MFEFSEEMDGNGFGFWNGVMKWLLVEVNVEGDGVGC